MFDLKDQLLKAGLVSEKDIAKVDEEKHKARERKKARRKASQHKKSSRPPAPKPQAATDTALWRRRIEGLKKAGKSEQYLAIKQWVKRTRLDDPKAQLGEDMARYHFMKSDGQVGWLHLSPQLVEKLKEGTAGLIAFMSDHGLAHGVVPCDVAEDVAEFFPLWLRALSGDDRAGQIEKPSEAPPLTSDEKPVDSTVSADLSKG